jgi:hypothetical protein
VNWKLALEWRLGLLARAWLQPAPTSVLTGFRGRNGLALSSRSTAGIAKRDFLKPNTIAVRSRTDMEVSRHDNNSIEAEVPILRRVPHQMEKRGAWKHCEIFSQWKVIDQHCREITPIGIQSLLRNFAADMTPLGEAGIWIWMQEHLVGANPHLPSADRLDWVRIFGVSTS